MAPGFPNSWPLLLSLLLLSSCSKLSVGVYWADTFAVRQLDDYFTLGGERKEKAQEEFRLAFQEVRRSDFPVLAEVFEGIAADVEKGRLSEAGLEQWSAKALGFVRSAARRFEPLGQRLVAEEAPRGFSRFDEAFAEKQEEAAEKLATPEGRLRQARRRIERVVKETVGELSPAQEAKVDELLRENPLLLEQENRRAVFEKFRAARDNAETRVPFLKKYFFEWESLQLPAYLRARDEYNRKSRAVMLAVLASASDKQKRHLVDNFRARAAELRKLSHP